MDAMTERDFAADEVDLQLPGQKFAFLKDLQDKWGVPWGPDAKFALIGLVGYEEGYFSGVIALTSTELACRRIEKIVNERAVKKSGKPGCFIQIISTEFNDSKTSKHSFSIIEYIEIVKAKRLQKEAKDGYV